jgi:hypothetical protein
MKKTIVLCMLLLMMLIPICASSQIFTFKKEYKPGFYMEGTEKVSGYIYFSEVGYDEFLFKTELDGKKTRKRVTDCDGFEFDSRKFVVITNIEMKVGMWNVSASRAFAELAIDGPVMLYKVYYQVGNGNPSAPGSSQVINWYLEKKGARQFVHVPPNKKKLREMATDFFKDRPDIIAKIEDENYKSEQIVDIVNEYNAGQ